MANKYSTYNRHNQMLASTVTPAAAQLWRDAGKNNRPILVLEIDQINRRAVCVSLKTGKITKPQLARFNRGATGFLYFADLKEAAIYQLAHGSKQTIKQSPRTNKHRGKFCKASSQEQNYRFWFCNN